MNLKKVRRFIASNGRINLERFISQAQSQVIQFHVYDESVFYSIAAGPSSKALDCLIEACGADHKFLYEADLFFPDIVEELGNNVFENEVEFFKRVKDKLIAEKSAKYYLVILKTYLKSDDNPNEDPNYSDLVFAGFIDESELKEKLLSYDLTKVRFSKI